MCGIFGLIGKNRKNLSFINSLSKHAKRRGSDSSGIMLFQDEYLVQRADFDISTLIKGLKNNNPEMFLGIGRLITNDNYANQPFLSDNICVFHNGIVVNDNEVFEKEKFKRISNLDTEVFYALVKKYSKDINLEEFKDIFLSKCRGTFSVAIALPKLGKLILFSNHGSLYIGYNEETVIFSSEKFHLLDLNCKNIINLNKEIKVLNIPIIDNKEISLKDHKIKRRVLVSNKKFSFANEKILDKTKPHVVRCRRCILPHTFPFINFNQDGVCNYCINYKNRITTKTKKDLLKILYSYRKKNGPDCIVPFSGGRDSSYSLHLIKKELDMKPITYTYDWGMTSDIGRRNISRVCSQLGIENIIVSANIQKKRNNIRKNINAWLKNPHLGMVNIFTAGDKHFYKYIEDIKKETGIKLNLWGYSPFEVTHFKSGFLGYPPDFETERTYTYGAIKQLKYQFLRFKTMFQNPAYFNLSLWDSLSGEYYRSFKKKEDYYYIYDYLLWDENIIDKTLINEYDWELAKDTSTTWRIGDGTAGFYNYIYYTIAGFTEHDTFRSNQVREGVITRDKAMKLIEEENKPRYENIAEYLEMLDLDFEIVINRINSVPRLWHQNPM
tara:strand:- start:15709 stop:17538 length:1830 start_codon:yes stop_codon:yes gene_type:complete